MILHIIDETNALLDTYKPIAGKAKLENCALYCLNIIERTLSQQEIFFDAHFAANCSILMAGINKLLLGVNYRSGKPDHMLNIVKFVTYNSWLPTHALVAVRILVLVARQPGINAVLLSEFTRTLKLTNEIRHGFVECLESDVPFAVPDSDENECDAIDYIELTIKEEIIKLLAECLPQSAPNLAHYLLGFDITKDVSNTLLQQPGVLDFPSNCTKSLVTILDEGILQIKSGMEIPIGQQRLLQNGYRLLYALCSNQKTSEVILRFLRSSNDFLLRHISALPFRGYENSFVLNQMTGLLKCVAIELKVTAGHNQVKQFKNLSDILLGAIDSDGLENGSPDASHYYSVNATNRTFLQRNESTFIGQGNRNDGDRTAGLLICKLLECLNFDIHQVERPKFEFFGDTQIHQLFTVSRCECFYSVLESSSVFVHFRIASFRQVRCRLMVQS